MMICQLHKTLHTGHGNVDLNVSIEAEPGTLITLHGPSGAGKTTVLRMLAGLASPEKGYIRFGHDVWFDSEAKIDLPPQRRKIGFVFQDYALFPHMSVRENLEYALPKKTNSIVNELVGVMDLEQLQNRKPETLSGGQKQRVALARALVREPELLLLDEPLSALDSEMRLRLQDHILKVHKQFHLTTILVSHDFAEIYKMSDMIYTLENGRITRLASKSELVVNTEPHDVQLVGEIIEVTGDGNTTVVSVAVAGNVIRTTLIHPEANFRTGDKVLVGLQAINPLIRKI